MPTGSLLNGGHSQAANNPPVVGWNASDANSAIVLFDHNTKVRRDAVSTDWAGIASQPVSGKVYWEISLIDPDTYTGVCNESLDTSTASYDAIDFWGYRRNGFTNRDGVVVQDLTGGGDSDVYRFWLDTAAGKMWLAISGGSPLGGGDPAAGTTPTFSTLDGTTYRLFHVTRDQTLVSQAYFARQTWLHGPGAGAEDFVAINE